MSGRSRRGLVVVHYHFRPGGVRRAIETALPAVAAAGEFERVTLFCGERPESAWLAGLEARCAPARVEVVVETAAGYVAEMGGGCLEPAGLMRRLRRALAGVLRGARAVWAHNLALGRNILLADALRAEATAAGVAVTAHHHDFFFDGRWGRWREFERAGFGTAREALAALFLEGCPGNDAAVNRADAALLSGSAGECVWLPNPVAAPPRVSEERLGEVRRWLRARAGLDGREGAVWVLPARILRRKNILEAVLLARVFNPRGGLVVTGGVSSEQEAGYAEAVEAAARRGGWRVVLNALGADGAPAVAETIAAADALALTSLREGFGLTLVEGAMAGRPQLARRRGAPAGDLEALGLRGVRGYEDIAVPEGLIDGKAEEERAGRLLRQWLGAIPPELRPEWDNWVCSRAPVFSRLTLAGQLDALARGEKELAGAIREANPEAAAAAEGLAEGASFWAGRGDEVSPERFAARLAELLLDGERVARPGGGVSAVLAWRIRARLAGTGFYPLDEAGQGAS